MSRGEILAFVGAAGGAAIGWTVGEKVGAGALLAGAGLLTGIVGAHLVNTQLLPPPPPSNPPLAGMGGYDPFKTESAWYYVDSWAWFVGSWTHAGYKGPFWGTDYGATQTEDALAFDVHKTGAKYALVRRFRWTGTQWIREILEGDWSRKYSYVYS